MTTPRESLGGVWTSSWMVMTMGSLMYWSGFVSEKGQQAFLKHTLQILHEHCMLLASPPPLGGSGAGALPCWEL
eukprot:COSAG04_NODE_8340_length_988_cov_0.932508_2_plen_73_part_01